MMNPKILKANPPRTLAELFIRPNRWVQHANAKNAKGELVETNAPCATRWCLTAGINLVYHESQHEMIAEKLLAYINGVPVPTDPEADIPDGQFESLESWNDCSNRTFADIRKACLQTGV
jgi:hypothetical protein